MTDSKTPLRDAVRTYIERDAARFHMPGHKGIGEQEFAGLQPYDITEVEGADNLFHARGPLLRLEEAFADAYGAKRTLLSAGGATLCIQTMLALACGTGRKLIAGRNLHRSAINAMALLGLDPVWIYPDGSAGEWYQGRYTASAVRAALLEHSDASAVYLTSPDYFGVMSDLPAIAEICRAFDVPLLVDNAHGAHLKFLPERYGSPHPIDCGAAMCADSLHKTMPAMTGAALLHIGDSRYAEDAKRLMSMFGSTSPSYPILLSCETALQYALSGAKAGFSHTARRLEELSAAARTKGFALPEGMHDPAKLTLGFAAAGWDGGSFGTYLRGHGIEPEYISGTACVLMANGRNREEDYQRLAEAITAFEPKERSAPQTVLLPRPVKAAEVREAAFSTQFTVDVENAVGKIAAGEVSPCPPGIPVVMPGERIDEETAAALKTYGIGEVSVMA